MQTGDADFAQFHEISVAVGDTLPPILDVLHRVDPTFREVPDGRVSATTSEAFSALNWTRAYGTKARLLRSTDSATNRRRRRWTKLRHSPSLA
jgi:hypothetical protein